MKQESVKPVSTYRLTFPFAVRQVSEREIVVETGCMVGSLLKDGAIESIAPDLSASERDRLHDDITFFAIGEGIKRSIRVS